MDWLNQGEGQEANILVVGTVLDPLYVVPNPFLRTMCVLENKADSAHLQRRQFRLKEKYLC